jgi:hypothetical protein
MQENNPYAVLFGSIELHSEEHIDLILGLIDKEHANYYLVEAVRYAYQRGLYSFAEVEIISKSIRVLAKKGELPKEGG